MFGRTLMSGLMLVAICFVCLPLTGCGGHHNPYDDPDVIIARSRAEVERQKTEQARIDAEARVAAARAAEEAEWQGRAELTDAKTEQAERLAASRQMERDAAAQRFQQNLPTLLLILTPPSLLAFGLVVYLLSQRRGPVDPAMLYLLQEQQRQQRQALLEQQRQYYHALATMQRRSLAPVTDRRLVLRSDVEAM